MTSASSSSSSTDRRSSEPQLVANAVLIKEELIVQEDSYEVYPSTSIHISPEAAADAQVKLEEMFNWSGKENDGHDGQSY